ncbi:phospholipase D family protein [Variovorax defluvii]|uniref:phospholipase D family nuclease n=1 Tax=Variovorax defluvii TaxID=913761 RepID=UPI0031EDD200
MNAPRPQERWVLRFHRAIRPHGLAFFACILLAGLSLRGLAAHAEIAGVTPQPLRAVAQGPIASAGATDAAAPVPSAPVYSAAFTPGHALRLVLDTIRGAKATLLVAAYSFTSKPVATALRDAQRRGVQVFVVVDAGEAAKGYSAARFLANERVPVRVNARYALQHNKFIVVDGAMVQTGSFNYTASAAERNAENVLVVSNAPDLAARYGREWRRLWDEGTELPPAY